MPELLDNFSREGPGRWICRRSCTIQSPVGRIQVAAGTKIERGLKFMNFDLAAALDEAYVKPKKQT